MNVSEFEIAVESACAVDMHSYNTQVMHRIMKNGSSPDRVGRLPYGG